MKIVLIGPPASGKGSQANLIEKYFNLSHISTGDMFREIMQEKTYLGRQVKGYMDNAQMIPDSLAIQVVENHISKPKFKKGFVLDGYPRTLKQAQELDEIMNIDLAILLDVKVEEITKRVTSRVICKNCGEVYSTVFYKGNFCLVCGNNLVHRTDDTVDTILRRVAEYEELTVPVIEHYKQQGKLKVIKGNHSIEAMFSSIRELLSEIV